MQPTWLLLKYLISTTGSQGLLVLLNQILIIEAHRANCVTVILFVMVSRMTQSNLIIKNPFRVGRRDAWGFFIQCFLRVVP